MPRYEITITSGRNTMYTTILDGEYKLPLMNIALQEMIKKFPITANLDEITINLKEIK